MTLPVMQIFRESFLSFKENRLSWVRIAFAPVLIIAIGFSVYLSIEIGQGLEEEKLNFWKALGNIIYMIFSFIGSGCLLIKGYRYGILKEGGTVWWELPWNKQLLRIILYILLIFCIMVGFVLTGFLLIFAAQMMFENLYLNIVLGTIVASIAYYTKLRLTLVFPLISIDKEFPLKTSWKMLQGNILRLVGLFLLINLKIIGIMLLGLIALSIVGYGLYLISEILVIVPVVLGCLFLAYTYFVIVAVLINSVSLAYVYLNEKQV